MKKLTWAFILVFLLAGAVTWAGGKQSAGTEPGSGGAYRRDPNLNQPGTFPINKEKVSLRIGIEQNAMVEDWETNWMTRQLEEKGNYDLSFEVYPAGEMNQKLELMIMAGGTDLPDVMMGSAFNLATVTKYGQAGMIIPVNGYYKTSAHYINQELEKFTWEPWKYITSYDGNIYGLFRMYDGLNDSLSGGRIIIYEPWLQKLGLSMPQSIDEYLNVLRAFRDKDPNGNGINDEIPLIGYKEAMVANYLYAMMTPFIYTQSNFWTLDNGKIDVAFNKPQWREGLRFTKQLIDEKLLSPLSFTQDQTQLTAMVSPNPPKVGSFVRISASNLGITDTKRVEYVVLPPLEGPSGRQQVWNPTLPGIAMLITKNCKTPESAFMLGDYMCSEEMSIATRFGEKDVDWVIPEPHEKGTYASLGYKAVIKPLKPWGIMQNKWWASIGPFIQPPELTQGILSSSDLDHTLPIGRTISPAVQYMNRNPIVGLQYNEQEQEIMNDLHPTIIAYVQESYARFVMGDLNIERDWDSYIAEFSRMRLSDVVKATQSCWDRMNKE